MPNGSADRGQDFAALIREGRARRGWTQDQLVAESGVSKSTLVRWESGRAERPDPDQVRELCRALGIDPRQAAVALGYLSPEDLAPADGAAAPLPPAIQQVIQILEDPAVPEAEKEQWINYLLYLRNQAHHGRRATG